MGTEYDENLDEEIWNSEFKTKEGNGFQLSVMQYNHNAPKIQVSRFYTDKHGKKGFGRLGRITGEEAIVLSKALITAKDAIKVATAPETDTEEEQYEGFDEEIVM
jgi:hypothetical protein